MNIRSLEYIWDEAVPEGTVLTSPFSANIKLIVIHLEEKDSISGWWKNGISRKITGRPLEKIGC